MVEKNHPKNGPSDGGFFDDLTERVFKDYELPKPADPAADDDDACGDENQQAA